MIRIDMSEYVDRHAVDRLIGGSLTAEGLLTAKIREQPFSVVLLDEFEKAHASFLDLLLQVLGEGRLTDGAAGGELRQRHRFDDVEPGGGHVRSRQPGVRGRRLSAGAIRAALRRPGPGVRASGVLQSDRSHRAVRAAGPDHHPGDRAPRAGQGAVAGRHPPSASRARRRPGGCRLPGGPRVRAAVRRPAAAARHRSALGDAAGRVREPLRRRPADRGAGGDGRRRRLHLGPRAADRRERAGGRRHDGSWPAESGVAGDPPPAPGAASARLVVHAGHPQRAPAPGAPAGASEGNGAKGRHRRAERGPGGGIRRKGETTAGAGARHGGADGANVSTGGRGPVGLLRGRRARRRPGEDLDAGDHRRIRAPCDGGAGGDRESPGTDHAGRFREDRRQVAELAAAYLAVVAGRGGKPALSELHCNPPLRTSVSLGHVPGISPARTIYARPVRATPPRILRRCRRACLPRPSR